MVELRQITQNNFDDVIKLKLAKEQEGFIASNSYSLAQAYANQLEEDSVDHLITFAIYHHNEIVGFTMAGYWAADENEHDNDDQAYYAVIRFMIDISHQGKGYGKSAMMQLIEHLKTFPRKPASSIYLSYKPENDKARKMYAGFGFVETGEISQGEVVARLKI